MILIGRLARLGPANNPDEALLPKQQQLFKLARHTETSVTSTACGLALGRGETRRTFALVSTHHHPSPRASYSSPPPESLDARPPPRRVTSKVVHASSSSSRSGCVPRRRGIGAPRRGGKRGEQDERVRAATQRSSTQSFVVVNDDCLYPGFESVTPAGHIPPHSASMPVRERNASTGTRFRGGGGGGGGDTTVTSRPRVVCHTHTHSLR